MLFGILATGGYFLLPSLVAEGIGTGGQLDRLQALGCGFGQEYYFARPLPDAEAREFLAGGPLTFG